MPGWSLWLVPPRDSIVDKRVGKLISDRIPKLFPDIQGLFDFAPHVTLISGIVPDEIKADPQKWLDDLKLEVATNVHVRFVSLQSEEFFFKRLFLRCEKDPALVSLAMQCRRDTVDKGDQAAAQEWAASSYDPHCSLMYADKKVNEEMMSLVKENLDGVGMVGAEARAGEGVGAGRSCDQPAVGWVAGRIWLVATDSPINDWKPVAERPLFAKEY